MSNHMTMKNGLYFIRLFIVVDAHIKNSKRIAHIELSWGKRVLFCGTAVDQFDDVSTLKMFFSEIRCHI